MTRKSAILATLFLAAVCSTFSRAANAHGPLPFPRIGFGSHAAISGALLGGIHLSGSERSFQLINSAYARAGYSGAIATFTGGSIVGGTLTGTAYGTTNVVTGGIRSLVVIVTPPPPPAGTVYGGQGSITIGNGGGAPNGLFFVNNTRPITGVLAPPLSINGIHLSGATRAILSQGYASLTGGYNAGVNSFNGPLVGGEIQGTAYLPGGANSGNTFLLAFGRDPLNVPGIPGTAISLPQGNGYITFANGITKQLYSGQLIVSRAFQTFPSSPQLALFLPGSAGAIGIDPFNRFSTPILTGAHNYLMFFAPLARAAF
jgi:hypothetical protein